MGFVSRQIIATLRNYQCFDLYELNREIWKKLDEINTEAFQKRPGSRKQVFDEEEKHHLLPLRNTRFKLSEWRSAKVDLSYHLQVDKMHYSVPYEYIRSEVDIRITKDLIEVYFNDYRTQSHKRLTGAIGQHSTNPDHMPDNHRLFLEHTPENTRKWAEKVGPEMLRLVDTLLDQNPEKRALNLIMTLKGLARNHSKADMEKAAKDLLQVSSRPMVSVYKTILTRNKTRATNKNEKLDVPDKTNYNFIRGKDYFRGEDR